MSDTKIQSDSEARSFTMNVLAIDAFIVDLDGVVTQTAKTHYAAWKMLFDDVLSKNDATKDRKFEKEDYATFVDGRPRYEGVQNFLKHVGIELPFGETTDEPGYTTMCALGNMKNVYFRKALEDGVQVYQTTVSLLQQLKYRYNIKLAVVSSSKNLFPVLESAKLDNLFDASVDGWYSERERLRGKPEPDTYLRACTLLDVSPQRSVMVEDALVGVAAGQKGGFATVIGINRSAGVQNLLDNGADVVLNDLEEVVLAPSHSADELKKLSDDPSKWKASWDRYEPGQQMLSETLCAMGNGFFCTRGSFPFEEANNKYHCPGTYLAGHYNRLNSVVNGGDVPNEDLVCFPNWQFLSFRITSVDGDSDDMNAKRAAMGLRDGWLTLDGEAKDVIDESKPRFEVLEFERDMDTRFGILRTAFTVRDAQGHITRVTMRQLVHMQRKHLGAIEMIVTPLNWSGELEVRAAINGRVENIGVPRYRSLNQKHTVPVTSEAFTPNQVLPELPALAVGPYPPKRITEEAKNAEMLCVMVRTVQSRTLVAEATRVNMYEVNGVDSYADMVSYHSNVDEDEWDTARGTYSGELDPSQKHAGVEEAKLSGVAAQYYKLKVQATRSIVMEKIGAVHTSKEFATSEPAVAAKESVITAPRFGKLCVHQQEAWTSLWHRFDTMVDVVPDDSKADADQPKRSDGGCLVTKDDVQVILRLHTFHLLQSLSPNSIGADIGIPARGWNGEAYRGHIFWDEVYIAPFITYRLPALTASLLKYRFRRLYTARRNAKECGFLGAMYPWQSSSDGREESQRLHLNPKSGRWIPDNSSLQRHSNLAICYNFWHYFRATNDVTFMQVVGTEVIVSVARFFASAVEYNEAEDRYELHKVMGPDEYHDAYPEEEDKPDGGQAGLSNNAYTNVLLSWLMNVAGRSLALLNDKRRRELCEKLRLNEAEISKWHHMQSRMKVCFFKDEDNNTIISQFQGYGDLKEFDWDGARKKHGNIQRLDRILESENDSCNRYKLSKQADTLMLMYLFPIDKVVDMFKLLGYTITKQDLKATVMYYLKRTSHGSSLSHLVHAHVLAQFDGDRSWKHFMNVLLSDVRDIQGGTTREGIHLGCMTGSVDIVQRSFTGLSIRNHVFYLKPALPEHINSIAFRMRFQSHWIRLCVTNTSASVAVETIEPVEAITAVVDGNYVEMSPGREYFFTFGDKFSVQSCAI
jgi:HAD superfamily hydrolase (TIGR01509 family)